MAHGDERRSKHRQGGSASSSGPSAKPKQLAKRKRPLPCDSSSKDSPPRGGTPESPDETKCLKMISPVSHINWEGVNYSKEDPMNLITLCNHRCYSSPNERGTDEGFWTFFHQDWYRSVLYPKASLVVKHQFVHINYMRAKKDMHFNKILEACDFHEITELLQFRHNWNQEVIVEFYSTLFYDKKERIFMWMTKGRRFNVKLSPLLRFLGCPLSWTSPISFTLSRS
jgi:hypothetical protein